MQEFKSEQLPYFIDNLKLQKFSGAASIQVKVSPQGQLRERTVTFYEGCATYAGAGLMTARELAVLLGRSFKLQVMASAIQLANKKMPHPDSIRDYLDLFVRLDLFQWQDVKTFMETKLLSNLEQLIPYEGTISFAPDAPFDLYYSQSQPGFSWSDLRPVYDQRQQQWAALKPVIPSFEAIPQVLKSDQADAVVAKHLQQWVDGQNAIADIATAIEKDQLKLAQLYYKWAKKGLITCGSSAQDPVEISNDLERPIVLSVDDSSVVQTMIKRAISDRYQVVLANNAVDALNILNRQKVSLMLLDVTMPDIDGLELCRTIRSIGKFRDLPVIMLTAKDGMFNKIKGQMAGSTYYLTKPIEREKMLEVIDKYVLKTVKF